MKKVWVIERYVEWELNEVAVDGKVYMDQKEAYRALNRMVEERHGSLNKAKAYGERWSVVSLEVVESV